MKVELELENQYDLKSLIAILEETNGNLEWHEYRYGGCGDNVYNDLSLLSSVINQLKEACYEGVPDHT